MVHILRKRRDKSGTENTRVHPLEQAFQIFPPTVSHLVLSFSPSFSAVCTGLHGTPHPAEWKP